MISVSEVLECWKQPVILKTVTITSVDFVETQTVTRATIDAVIQPAKMDELKAENIDYSLNYLMMHSVETFSEGQFVEYKGEDFKIISINHYSDYGYTEGVLEQTKKAVL